jgi:hypothetical protein
MFEFLSNNVYEVAEAEARVIGDPDLVCQLTCHGMGHNGSPVCSASGH